MRARLVIRVVAQVAEANPHTFRWPDRHCYLIRQRFQRHDHIRAHVVPFAEFPGEPAEPGCDWHQERSHQFCQRQRQFLRRDHAGQIPYAVVIHARQRCHSQGGRVGKRVRVVSKGKHWPAGRVGEEGPKVPCEGWTTAYPNVPSRPCKNTSLPGEKFCFKHLSAEQKAERAEVRRTCTSKSARTGKPCRRAPMTGQLVCGTHGGNSPQAKHAAAIWNASKEAQIVLAKLGAIAPVENALEALQQLAGEVLAWKDACATFVAALDPEQYRYGSQFDLEQIRGEVLIYQDAMKTAVETLTKLSRVQVDERLAAIEEAKANMIIEAFGRALGKAGDISDDDRAAAYAEFGRRLKVIPGGKAA